MFQWVRSLSSFQALHWANEIVDSHEGRGKTKFFDANLLGYDCFIYLFFLTKNNFLINIFFSFYSYYSFQFLF